MRQTILGMWAVMLVLASGVVQAGLRTYDLQFVGLGGSTLTGQITTSVMNGPLRFSSDISAWWFTEPADGLAISSDVSGSAFFPGGPPWLTVTGNTLTFDFTAPFTGNNIVWFDGLSAYVRFLNGLRVNQSVEPGIVEWYVPGPRLGDTLVDPPFVVGTAVVPEPSLFAYFGIALATGFWVARKRVRGQRSTAV